MDFVDRDSFSIQKLKSALNNNWDVLLVFSVSIAVLFYNLTGWRGVTVEEWQFYRDFMNNWFASLRIHSFFIPSYVLAYFVPSRDFMVLRHFTALLTGLGIALYYMAVKRASSSKIPGFIAAGLVLTDAWLLWYGRHFIWVWSAVTLTALAFYLFIRFREKSIYANSVLAAVSILNLSQSVFFAFPFLASQFYSLRDRLELKQVVLASALFVLLIVPSVWVFLEKQDSHLAVQEGPDYQVDEFVRVEQDYYLPTLGEKTFTVVLNPFNTFTELKKRIGIPTHGLYHFDWSSQEQHMYTLIAAAVLAFPVYFRVFSDWEHRDFFILGALGVFVFFVVFPFLTDESYFWSFSLFLYPLLAKGCYNEKRRIKLVAIVLTVALMYFQGVTAYDQVLTYDYKERFDSEIGEQIEGKDIIVTERAHGIAENSDMGMLENSTYEVIPCHKLRNRAYERLKFTSDACQLSEEVMGNVRWLKLYN